jgi:hypothetical protein
MALHIKYKLQNIAHLISIRDFINSAINGMGVSMSRPQIKEMSNKLTAINALLVSKALELNLEELEEPKMVFESTQDVDDVMKQIASYERDIDISAVVVSDQKIASVMDNVANLTATALGVDSKELKKKNKISRVAESNDENK